jgi:hypothetical protein
MHSPGTVVVHQLIVVFKKKTLQETTFKIIQVAGSGVGLPATWKTSESNLNESRYGVCDDLLMYPHLTWTSGRLKFLFINSTSPLLGHKADQRAGD